jgi:hypothetical protein
VEHSLQKMHIEEEVWALACNKKYPIRMPPYISQIFCKYLSMRTRRGLGIDTEGKMNMNASYHVLN